MHQSLSYLNSVCKGYKSFKALLVEDPKTRREPDVKMVDILKINMYLHCKVFWVLVLVGVMLRIRFKALGYSTLSNITLTMWLIH
jgi:hypothetical protein